MEITDFLTADFLASFTGTLIAVELIVFVTKDFPLIKKIPTKIYTLILAIAHLSIERVATGCVWNNVECYYRLFINALVVVLILCGGYDTVMLKFKGLKNINEKKESKFINEGIISKSTITADIEYRILMYTYDNKNLPEFNHLIEVLTKTEFHDRLDKYIPQEIVAHKIGSNESYIHDVGIIFSDSPYILVIYTNGLAYPDEKIAQISKAIYNNYN